MKHIRTMRVAAIVAVCGALGLAGCGGGSGGSTLPSAVPAGPSGGGSTQAKAGNATATLSIVGLPETTSAQSSGRTSAIPASTKRSTAGTRSPQYLDTTTLNSAIVITVQPQDPAEAAQYGTLNVCYNLYTNGTLNGAIANGSPPVVSVAFPAPPGTDGFQVTQYVGQCTSSYTVPTPPVGTANGGVLSQTPLVYAPITAGAPATTNNINTLVAACTQPVTPPAPGSGFTCAGPGSGVTTITSTIAIAKVQFDAKVPITNPVREQGGFLTPGTNTIGVPIPLEAINAAGTVVSGLTTPLNPTGGSGPFPSGVTVTLSELTTPTGAPAAPTHAKLYLMDAKTGAIAQAGQGANQTISITEFNALAAADNVTPGGGTVGDQWVLVLAYDGSGYSKVVSETVTATATTANAALPSPISLTISPQSAIYSAGGTGYADLATPTAPVGLLQPTSGGPIYVSDGSTLKIDGTATVSAPANGTALTGLASAAWPNATNFIYAVDEGQTGGASATEAASGLYAFNPTTLASTPVSAAAGANNYIQFPNPVAVVQAQGGAGAGHPYLFVVSQGGGIYRVDISGASEIAPVGGFQEATNVLPIIPISASSTALNPGTVKYLGTTALSGGQFLIADPGNNRIAEVDATQNPAVITTWASGQPFVGFTLPNYPTSAAMYATTTSGQVYYIAASGATPVSLGFSTSTTVTDGPIGQVTSFTGTNTLTPVNYPLQGQAASFFATTATPNTSGYATPYTVAPFAAVGPVFSVVAAGIGLANDTSSGGATGNGTVNATGGILVIPSTATTAATVTPGSILFTDIANKKLRTIVQ
jgi:hypothetical protein